MIEITDVHNHILYGVDDGADSIETSMKILKLEYDQGVRNIILTPHFHIGECMPKRERIQKHFDVLSQKVKETFSGLKLYLGNEIMACNDMVSMINNGRLYTLAGTRYVLIEFFPTVSFSEMERYLKEILNGGYIPIIAHCERYKCLRKSIGIINKERINYLIEMGAYFQVNAYSVYREDKRFVEKMIDNDFLHLIATDTHGVHSRSVYWEESVKYLKKKYSEQYLQWILEKNPQKILDDEYIS